MGAVVYLIDDDHSFRTALCRLLRSLDFAVKPYPSASEFLKERPSNDQPACLVLDIDMPGMSGLDLQEYLRELGSSLPVIFLTGNTSKASRARAARSGAKDFLIKPVRKETLVAAISRVTQ